MKKKYACKKDLSFGILLAISSLVIWTLALLSILLGNGDPLEYVIPGLIAIVVTGLFLWLWMGTFYLLDQEKLTAKAGPFRWKVTLHEIRHIRLNQKTIGGTWKLTLAWDCMEIKYDKAKSVFITPLDEEGFLSDLSSLNQDVIIKEK